jgi:O-antigen/teichoic acid export membrane protein
VTSSQRSLRDTALDGVRWTAGARVLAESAGLLSVVVTAHLLTPKEVGQAAVALVVSAVAFGLAQQGFGSPIVRKPELGHRDAETAHSLSLIAGLALGGLVAGFASALASLFGGGLTGLIQLAALGFPLAAIGAVPMALLQRDLKFKDLAVIDALASAASGLSIIVAAVSGAGAASLVIGPLVLYGVTSAGATLRARNVRPRWSWSAANELGRFGSSTAASGLFYIIIRNIDYAILAARLPAAQVGYYYRAYQLGGDYQSKVSGILLRMALPLFSRAQSIEELRRIRGRMSRVHALVLFPLLVALIGIAPEAIPLVFGAQWEPAVVPTQILSVAGMVAVVGTGAGPLLTAAGRPRALLEYSIGSLVIYAGAVWFAVPYGIVAVSAAAAGSKLVTLLWLQKWYIERIVGIPATDVLKYDLAPALTASAPLLLITAGGGWILSHADAPDALTVLLLLPLGGLSYVLALRFGFRDAWTDLLSLTGRTRKTPAPIAHG